MRISSAALAIGIAFVPVALWGFHATLLLILDAGYAAFCVWLIIRTIARRERWAKRTLAVALAVPVIYFLSLGPVWWLRAHALPASAGRVLDVVYSPIGILLNWEPFNRWTTRYLNLWVALQNDPDGQNPDSPPESD